MGDEEVDVDALEAAVLPERELMSLLNPTPDATAVAIDAPEADAAGTVDAAAGTDSVS